MAKERSVTQELVVNWLQKLTIMSRAQMKVLDRCSYECDQFPEIRAELQDHLADTRVHLHDLRDCLDDLGGTFPRPSASTERMILQLVHSIGGGRFHDTMVRDLLVLQASEHFAQAAFLATAEAARLAQLDQVADICERAAEEEMAMAEWVEEQMPAVVAACINLIREKV